MLDAGCSRYVRAARTVLLVGWLPLLLYIPFDALTGGGGDPIVLGLLMGASTAVASLLLALESLRLARRRGSSGAGAPPDPARRS